MKKSVSFVLFCILLFRVSIVWVLHNVFMLSLFGLDDSCRVPKGCHLLLAPCCGLTVVDEVQ